MKHPLPSVKNNIIVPIIFFCAAVAVYYSVSIEHLDKKKEKERIKNFNPSETVAYFWKEKLDGALAAALDVVVFDSLLSVNPQTLISQYGKGVGISSKYCFLVKGTAISNEPGSEELPVLLGGEASKYSVRTKYIFGNTARDALGYFNVDDFVDTMDFNAIAAEINSRIIHEVTQLKIDSLRQGITIKFVGAIEIDSERRELEKEIIPLKLEIVR